MLVDSLDPGSRAPSAEIRGCEGAKYFAYTLQGSCSRSIVIFYNNFDQFSMAVS